MPARITEPSMTAKMPAAKRFELPALDFKFASLTEGTDIPPPLPSPVKEVPTPPATPKATPNGKDIATDKANGTTANGTNGAAKAANGSLKRPAEDLPLSPALSSRQGSIRRLFSRNLLNNAYTEGEIASDGIGLSPGRPASRAESSVLDDKKARRGSGWFRRLRTGDSTVPKRTSSLYEPVTPKKPLGPPPPMIPELSALKNKLDVDDGGSLGNNLFSDIK